MRPDHVIPQALGGTDNPGNLVTACVDCNAGKAAMPPDAPLVADVTQDAMRWAAAMRRAAELQRADDERDERALAWFDELWSCFTDGQDEPLPRPDDWRRSVLTFFKAGLSGKELHQALDTANNNQRLANAKVWRYFCGVCWNRLAERREIAASLLATEEG